MDSDLASSQDVVEEGCTFVNPVLGDFGLYIFARVKVNLSAYCAPDLAERRVGLAYLLMAARLFVGEKLNENLFFIIVVAQGVRVNNELIEFEGALELIDALTFVDRLEFSWPDELVESEKDRPFFGRFELEIEAYLVLAVIGLLLFSVNGDLALLLFASSEISCDRRAHA